MTPSSPSTVYLTTAIDYVNAAPHLGHAYEKMVTDVMARFYRLLKVPTFFLTGTDEHGIKIQKNAVARNMDPKAFTDKMADQFVACWQQCDIRYDRFIRTTDPAHYAVVAHLWRTLQAKGDIYKAAYTGLYCSGCEAFLTERDLTEEGQCRIHQRAPEAVQEENYFFRLSAYKQPLLDHLQANAQFVQPAFRRQEVLNMLDSLEDISVSRSRQSVAWGIPVPDDPEQVIYVWIDALSNYLTGLGYNSDNPLEQARYNQFWGAKATHAPVIHIIGKDILRFHAIYWPAMLLAAELPLPTTIFAHGFITLNEEKISKSLGNVIAPADVIQHFQLANADPLRYYLVMSTPFGQDGNFSLDDMKLRVNADLANNLGNLLNRSLSMLGKYANGVVPAVCTPWDVTLLPLVSPSDEWLDTVQTAYQQFAPHTACELILQRVDAANRLINDWEPWTLHKEGQTQKLHQLLYAVLESLRQGALLLSPVVPTLAQTVWQQLGLASSDWAERQWAWVLERPLAAGTVTQPAGPILPRLDSELVGAAAKKK